MSLTSKELMLIEDNIKMTQNFVNFVYGCAEMCTDSQVKSLCEQMGRDHRNYVQTLSKHIKSANVQ